MAKYEKKHIFTDIIRNGLGYISQTLSASVFPQIAEGAEGVMNGIEDRAIQIEKRMLRRMSSFLVIGFGIVFLTFALFFFLRDFLGWSNIASFFSIGITIFVIGLLLKINESERRQKW